MFAFFKEKKDYSSAATGLYASIIAQSREPVFYELYSVPDTVDGRFDLICLHAYLVMERLKDQGKEGDRIAQALFDHMFRDMDRVLREMGIGDLGVPKHIKRMMKGFNGRAMAYREGMQSENVDDLVDVILRNLYGSSGEQPVESARIMALYMHETLLHLNTQPWQQLSAGNVQFKAMSYGNDEQEERPDNTGMVAQG